MIKFTRWPRLPRRLPRLTIWQHPWRPLAALLVLGAAAYAALQGYGWYHFRAGQEALEHYRTEQARADLDRCLNVWPDHGPAQLLAARAARRAGDFERAAGHLDRCREIAGRDPADSALNDEVAFEWALLQATQGDLPPVEEALQARLLAQLIDAPLIWEALADGYRRTMRMPESLNCVNAWLRLDPNNVQAFFLRGELHRQVGAVSRARDDYQDVIDRDPSHDRARRYLARCLVKVGRYQEATAHLERLRAAADDDPELEMLLARCEHDLGRREEAARRLDTLLVRHPSHGSALRERGRFALAANEVAAAARWLEQATLALPYDYEAHWSLQQALQAQGRTPEAAVARRRAEQLKDQAERINAIQMHEMTKNPRDAALHGELGILLLAAGQHAAGERWLRSALRLDPTLSAASAALADLYEHEGHPEWAEPIRRAARQVAVSQPPAAPRP